MNEESRNSSKEEDHFIDRLFDIMFMQIEAEGLEGKESSLTNVTPPNMSV